MSNCIKFGFILEKGKGNFYLSRANYVPENTTYPHYCVINEENICLLKEFLKKKKYNAIKEIVYKIMGGENNVKRIFFGIEPEILTHIPDIHIDRIMIKVRLYLSKIILKNGKIKIDEGD